MLRPPTLSAGDRIAVLSPSFAAPGFAPAVHEQAMERLAEVTGLVPVEFPTTRQLGASPQARAADLTAAFRDPAIGAIHASIGGDDQITVIGHLETDLARRHPTTFLGYSDNTHLHQWLWAQGAMSFYGGSTQVQLGPGPQVDELHARSLRAALLTGETLEITDPGESEDVGHDWRDPRALTETGRREPTEPWQWSGPEHTVTGPTWGGCLEVVEQVLLAGRFTAPPSALEGHVLILETSEELPSALHVGRVLRALGERGVLAAVDGVLMARPPVSDLEHTPAPTVRRQRREDQAQAVRDALERYNPRAVVCIGVPFGHTRPQWILPHGGAVTLDGARRRVQAHYS